MLPVSVTVAPAVCGAAVVSSVARCTVRVLPEIPVIFIFSASTLTLSFAASPVASATDSPPVALRRAASSRISGSQETHFTPVASTNRTAVAADSWPSSLAIR